MNTKRKPQYTPSRDGDHILVTIPHYWGRGATYAEAVHQLRNAGGTIEKDTEVHVYSVHPKTYVDEMHGDLHFPSEDHEPLRLNP